MLPYIEYVALNQKLIDKTNFVDIIGVSQIAPGPVSINTVMYIGFKNFGILGAIFGAISMISFSYIIVIIVHKFIMNCKINIINIIMNLRPLMIALIFEAFLNTAEKALNDIKSIIIFFICSILLYYKKNTLIVLVVAIILGIFLNK